MSISIKKYVDITSGVGGSAAVKERELILRLFTTNALVPAGTVMEMTDLNDVATTFGTTSEEYKRAAMYFGFVSKSITKAKKISFAHYSTATTKTPPSIMGGTPGTTNINDWKLITAGVIRVHIGSADYQTAPMNFSTATDLASVATKIQAALNATNTPANTFTVTYDNVGQRFNASFVGVNPPAAVSVIAPSSGNNIATQLGWTTAAGMATGAGSAATSILDWIVEADEISDNYGTFAVIGPALDLNTVKSIAAWNKAQNVKYIYQVPVTAANWSAWYTELAAYGGTGLTIVNDSNTEYDEQIPGVIIGATDYNMRAASQNFMFQQVSGVTPKVDDNSEATTIDNQSRVNYYGRTKNAGQPIEFYQNGYLCGTNTDPLQMNVYANEMWFKAAATAVLMSALLALPIIPATDEGRAIVLSILQDPIDRALYNGTIAVGKDLNVTQKAYVQQITGDPLAWHQIQSIGYWLDATVQEEAQQNGTIKYIIDYTLLYSKSDAVNKITGRDILI